MASLSDLKPKKLKAAIHEALRAWKNNSTEQGLLPDLLLVQQEWQKLDIDVSIAARRMGTNEILLAAMQALGMEDETAARVLQYRFADNDKIMTVAYKLNMSEHTVSHTQRKGIEKLTEIIADKEQAARAERIKAIEARLPPPPYTKLFGVDEHLQKIITCLLEKDAPWVAALVGIGGIGKTSLAHAVTREVVQRFRFEDAIWVRLGDTVMFGSTYTPESLQDYVVTDISDHLWPEVSQTLSPQQRLLQVRNTLKARPILVIIDNLETEADTAVLLDQLNNLANPSKFLITTRTHPRQSGVLRISLDQLSAADAAELMRFTAQESGIDSFQEAAAQDIAAIYALTGGNPLALKLVVSLLDVVPLPHILESFATAGIQAVEAMYKHIYWQSWRTIGEDGRLLLQTMPLVSGDGATLDYLKDISKLEDNRLWAAIAELRGRSLLDVWGDLNQKRYGIHPLTKSFLKTEIIHWSDEDGDE
jgi:hypothetical protein